MAQAAVEWKLIQPGRINITGYIDKLKAALTVEVDTIDGEFHKTTATWNHQPAFEKKVDMANAMDLRGSVMTTDKIYTYITRGILAAGQVAAGCYSLAVSIRAQVLRRATSIL